MAVIAELHPLVGSRLTAASFYRKGGEVLLVVDLPDGSPGMIPAAVTDIFGEPAVRTDDATVITVAGVRALRSAVAAIRARGDRDRGGRIGPQRETR